MHAISVKLDVPMPDVHYACQQQSSMQQLADTGALALILTHCCRPEEQDMAAVQQDIICRLLCVSKAMRAAIAHTCAGLVPVTFNSSSMQHASALCCWISAHGRLLKSLELLLAEPQLRVCFDAAIAAALQHAAASTPPRSAHLASTEPQAAEAAEAASLPQGLLLQHYKGPCISSAILQHLPSNHLTSLCSLSITNPCVANSSNTAVSSSFSTAAATTAGPAGVTAAAANGSSSSSNDHSIARSALAGLTKLRSLALHGIEADALLPAVSYLTNLTDISLLKISVSSVGQLQQLPAAQLQRLCFSVSPNIHGWQRKQLQPRLGYLTALQELSATGEGLFAVQAHDVLPLQLRALTIVDCPCPEPLLPLQHLKTLQVNASTMTAPGLRQLASTLRCLETVRLCYDRDPAVIAAAAAGWGALPLKNLELRVYPGPVTAATIQQLRRLTGLTHLTIQGFDVQFEATPAQFAGVLRQLTQLQHLKLASLKMLPDDMTAAAAAELAGLDGYEVAAAAIGGGGGGGGGTGQLLQQQQQQQNDADPITGRDPAISGPTGMCLLMQAVAGLPQLQSFWFIRFTVGAAEAAVLAAATQLTCLRLDECELTDAAIAPLGSSLVGLRKLSLNWNFRLSSNVVHGVALQLQQLQELSICSTRVDNVGQLQQSLPGLKVVV